MTRSEFKKAIERGLGRSVLAVKAAPEDYRDIVLWACGTNLAYDPQCEGTRAYYTYSLVMLYEDKTEFIDTAADALRMAADTWDICYFTELLSYFADLGYIKAKTTLADKYDALYTELYNTDAAPAGVFDAFDNYNFFIEYLIDSYESYRRIAHDIGKLFLQHPYLRDCEFSMYRNDHKDTFTAEPEKSKEEEAFLLYNGSNRTPTIPNENDQNRDISSYSGIALSNKLRNERIDVIESYADKYLASKTTEERISALKAFCLCPYPATYSPTPIISDAGSHIPELRETALRTLTKIRHPDVREYALRLMKTDPETGFPILTANYAPEDSTYITEYLSRLSVDRNSETAWHSHHFDVLSIFDKNRKTDLPPIESLPLIYETTLCSNCRLCAVHLMDEYGILSLEMLEECQCDSNADIRSFTREKLAERQK